MKVVGTALFLLPMAVWMMEIKQDLPVLDTTMLGLESYTETPWHCGANKRVLCALDDVTENPYMTATGFDKDKNKIFECEANLVKSKKTVQTCCRFFEQKRNRCGDKAAYDPIEFQGENVLALWVLFDRDLRWHAVSNGYTLTGSDVTSYNADVVVNATVIGDYGFKFCYPWTCEKGVDGSVCGVN